MELIVLGSGTYQPEVNRHSSGYLLKVEGQNIVFDFGRGVLDHLMKSGVEYTDIDVIFITHTHADHCSELASLLHISLAESIKGARRTKEIVIYGPEGIKDTINNILKAFGLADRKPRYNVVVRELGDGDKIEGNGWIVSSYNVMHSKKIKCLAYRLESSGKVFAYSGDTKDCPGLRKVCENADIAVIEASWPKEVESTDHLIGEETGKIAQESGVKKLVFTHVAPYYLKNFSVIDDVKRFYKGKAIMAKDLMKVTI